MRVTQYKMDLPLNFRQMQHLLLLADELHFGRAAERAFLSQSAFSRSIQALEASVGLRLFDRDLRSVRTTPAGIRMIARARRLLSSANDLSREMALLRSGDLGNVSAGAGPFSGASLMPGPLAHMQRRHPEVKLRLEVADSRTLLQRLDDEQIDFFIAEIRELPAREDCSVEKLGWLAGGLYCRAGHPLASRKNLRLADLKDVRFASVHMPDAMKATLDRRMQAQGASEFPIAFECDNFVVIRELALASDVVALAFPNVVRCEVDAMLMKRLTVSEFDAHRTRTPLRTEFGLVRLKERTPTPASEILIQLIHAEAGGVLDPATRSSDEPDQNA